MNNDEKVKEMLEKEPVPKELEPENIKAMLDEKNAEKKRSGISVAGRLAAAAAACAVIGGGSYAYLSGVKPGQNTASTPSSSIIETVTVPEVEQTKELFSQQAYMSGAEDYSQVYELLKLTHENENRRYRKYSGDFISSDAITNDIVEEAIADEATDGRRTAAAGINEDKTSSAAAVESSLDTPSVSEDTYKKEEYLDEEQSEFTQDESLEYPDEESLEITQEGSAEFSDDEQMDPDVPENENEFAEYEDQAETAEHSDTYNQEQDVLEADIAKTDGEYIYYISNSSNGQNDTVLRSAKVKDGKFLSSHTTTVDIHSFYENADYAGSYVEDMYLYNDMIVIIGDTFSEWYDGDVEYSNYHSRQVTYAAFYTTGDSPELIDVYFQDGSYDDVRIAPDGCMYLVTAYTSEQFTMIDDPEQYEYYIPSCGLSENCGLIPPEDILLPAKDEERSLSYVDYSIIGSIDLNTSQKPVAVDTKALTDYSGQLYASADNFYTAAQYGNKTDFTRIAIGGGGIAPAASATVDGYVKDQFSMSEYGGYFRAAVTRNNINKSRWWERVAGIEDENANTTSQDNAVYVFDMDMNQVGCVDDFGRNESIKSVNFQGDLVYVVTYERTDPLFAIDLSDPTAPTILDEFKINGYSTYMQKWTDGLLLGFGVNANDNAVETGIKMVMFDNSDPDNLKEVGFWSLDRGEGNNYSYVSSQAVWERKALLIAPEKNLIGFPVECESYFLSESSDYNWKYENKYMFFSYENGEFVEKGVIEAENDDLYDEFNINRAMYIGDYVYVLSGGRFIAADIATITVTDELNFSEGDRTEETTTEASTTEVTTTETTAETTAEETTAEETTSTEAETTTTTVVFDD